MTQHVSTLEQRAAQHLGADLVLEGGGVKGIGLAGAVIELSDAGYVFPRVGGTSAGAIVAALVAAYQTRGIPLSRLEDDMRTLDYTKFKDAHFLQRVLGPIGNGVALVTRRGIYPTEYLSEWLHSKLDPIDIRTFADLKITDDPHSDLPKKQRYRLVVHTADLVRKCLVRLPWDVPWYLLPADTHPGIDEQIAAIDAYPVIDAVRASMSIPFFFRPFQQPTPQGVCIWVDGGMLENFPVTVFDRTDGKPSRWPTFGIKLSARPKTQADKGFHSLIGEAMGIKSTALGEWNRYPLEDEGVTNRTIYVDTLGVKATEFGLPEKLRDTLYANGGSATQAFLQQWNAIPQPASIDLDAPPSPSLVPEQKSAHAPSAPLAPSTPMSLDDGEVR
jgi:NTE family protein